MGVGAAKAANQQSGGQTSVFDPWTSTAGNPSSDFCPTGTTRDGPAAAHAAPPLVKLMVPMSEQELAEWRVLQQCKRSLVSGAGMVDTGADGEPDRADAAGAPLQRTLTPVVNTLAL